MTILEHAKWSLLNSAYILQEIIDTSLKNNNKCIVAFYDVAKPFGAVWIDDIFDSGITEKLCVYFTTVMLILNAVLTF